MSNPPRCTRLASVKSSSKTSHSDETTSRRHADVPGNTLSLKTLCDDQSCTLTFVHAVGHAELSTPRRLVGDDDAIHSFQKFHPVSRSCHRSTRETCSSVLMMTTLKKVGSLESSIFLGEQDDVKTIAFCVKIRKRYGVLFEKGGLVRQDSRGE
jgi:hypothetical protein